MGTDANDKTGITVNEAVKDNLPSNKTWASSDGSQKFYISYHVGHRGAIRSWDRQHCRHDVVFGVDQIQLTAHHEHEHRMLVVEAVV